VGALDLESKAEPKEGFDVEQNKGLDRGVASSDKNPDKNILVAVIGALKRLPPSPRMAGPKQVEQVLEESPPRLAKSKMQQESPQKNEKMEERQDSPINTGKNETMGTEEMNFLIGDNVEIKKKKKKRKKKQKVELSEENNSESMIYINSSTNDPRDLKLDQSESGNCEHDRMADFPQLKTDQAFIEQILREVEDGSSDGHCKKGQDSNATSYLNILGQILESNFSNK
jgi:hypothetical protein